MYVPTNTMHTHFKFDSSSKLGKCGAPWWAPLIHWVIANSKGCQFKFKIGVDAKVIQGQSEDSLSP